MAITAQRTKFRREFLLRLQRGITLALLVYSGTVGSARAARIELVAGGGEGTLGGAAIGAKLINPFGVAFDNKGAWYVVEWKGHRVTKVDPKGTITLFAGTGRAAFAGDGGAADQAALDDPHRVVIDSGQQMYIADTGNNRVRKVDLATGKIDTVSGNGETGYSGDEQDA